MDLIDRRQDRARTFSRGMQQRLAIARALLHDPAVVLLDEPFTGLDPHASDRLEEMLHLLRDGKRTVVMTIHDLERGWAMCDRALVLARGKIVYEARTAEVDVATFRSEFKRVTAMTFFRKAWIIARKDILAELRSREMLSTMGAFAVLIILLFAFAFDLRTGSTGTAARASTVTPGALWVGDCVCGHAGVGSLVNVRDRSGQL